VALAVLTADVVVDNGGDVAILPAMVGVRNGHFWARGGITRVAVSAVLALLCVLALASGDARALCLDLGGECSPSAAVPGGPCHDQRPDSGTSSSCDSCVDILVHEDASAGVSRPDHEFRAPTAAQPFSTMSEALLATGGVFTAAGVSLAGSFSPHRFLRTAVLRI